MIFYCVTAAEMNRLQSVGIDSEPSSFLEVEVMGERDGYAQGEFCWVDVLSHGIEGVAPWYQAIFGWELDLTPTGGGPFYGY